jgi:hypothetical protein
MTDHHAHNRQVPGSNSQWARKHSKGDLTIAIRKLVLNDAYQSSQKIFNNWIWYRLCNNTQGTLIACFVSSSQEVTFRIALVLTSVVPRAQLCGYNRWLEFGRSRSSQVDARRVPLITSRPITSSASIFRLHHSKQRNYWTFRNVVKYGKNKHSQLTSRL